MMLMAPKGHFLTQIPQPIHSRSDMKAILDSGVTSMQSLPVRTTGHDFLHSCRHFFGLHLSLLIIAILYDGSAYSLHRGSALSPLSPCQFVRHPGGVVGCALKALSRECSPPLKAVFLSVSCSKLTAWLRRAHSQRMITGHSRGSVCGSC